MSPGGFQDLVLGRGGYEARVSYGEWRVTTNYWHDTLLFSCIALLFIGSVRLSTFSSLEHIMRKDERGARWLFLPRLALDAFGNEI